jgi:hypothetical protein
MPSSQKALTEFHRILVPGGVAVFVVWSSLSVFPLFGEAMCGIKPPTVRHQANKPADLRKWESLDYCIDQMRTAGFDSVEGKQTAGVFRTEDLRTYTHLLVGNPGTKSILAGWNKEEIGRLEKALEELIIEKYGMLDVYEFDCVANLVKGTK